MAENLNSVLAPHRAAHKGLPAPVLAVFAVYRNRRVFPRGKRAGHSPLDLLGLPSPHWLDALGYGRVAAPCRVRNTPCVARFSSRVTGVPDKPADGVAAPYARPARMGLAAPVAW